MSTPTEIKKKLEEQKTKLTVFGENDDTNRGIVMGLEMAILIVDGKSDSALEAGAVKELVEVAKEVSSGYATAATKHKAIAALAKLEGKGKDNV